MDNLSGTLCHYTTPDAAFQHIIPWGRLRMSPYARMRDPLENRELTFRAAEGSDDREAHGQLYERIRESVRRIRDRMLILSFTIDAMDRYADSDLPFMRAWARARMWEQYADNHAGVCIAFDRERALGHMEAQLNQLGSVGRGRVVYAPRGFSDTQASTLMLDRFCDDFSQKVAAFVVENEHDLFFTKTLDWQSEHEFRMTLFPNVQSDDGYVHVPFGDAKSVRAVILGERFPQWQLPAAKWACDQVGVELLTLQWKVGLPWPMPTA